MLVVAFLTWWYGQGWALVFRDIERRLQQTEQTFSVTQLMRTLFAPWRRIVSYPGSSFQAQVQALIDNSVSRLVGFTVRVLVLLAAGITLLGVILLAIVEVVAWPLAPIAIVAGLIKGLWP